MTLLAVDTSVAVPLLVATHARHDEVVRWWRGRELALSGHAAVETFSVITRLPGDLRVSPDVAAIVMRARFGATILLKSETAERVPELLGRLGIAGGAAYDALVALAAVDNDATLVTRDQRARGTYEAVGARVVIAG